MRDRAESLWFVPAKTRNDWRRLFTLPELPPSLPGDDHVQLFLLDGRPAAYVSQPYGVPDRAELDEAARKYGLDYVVIEKGGWHCPGSTDLIVWMPASHPLLAYIKGAV